LGGDELWFCHRFLFFFYQKVCKFAIRKLRISNKQAMKKNNGMRPQDIAILLKIAALGSRKWLMKDIANELYISASEVSESLNRSVYAGLIAADKQQIMKMAFLDFLRYGLKYVYPQKVGAIVRGMPTAYSAAPLNELIQSENVLVLPYAKGEIKGMALEPLIPSLPQACQLDSNLYELVALTDALRIGKAREQELAYNELKKRL
jgi:predicted transcriptional regulator